MNKSKMGYVERVLRIFHHSRKLACLCNMSDFIKTKERDFEEIRYETARQKNSKS